MSLKDFRKSLGQTKDDKNEEEKEIENKVKDGFAGNVHMGDNHTTRRLRINYHLGEEKLDELSSELLDRYKDKAKKSADDLASKGQYKKSADRWSNIMKATGKQIEKTTANIKNALNKEEVELEEGHDDYREIAKELIKRHGKNVKKEHIKDLENERDSRSPLDHDEVMHYVNKEEFEEISLKEFGDWTEEDFEKIVEQDLNEWTDDDMLELYEDDELAIIDDETGEEIEAVAEEAELDTPVLMEILSRQERIRAKARMRRSKTKRVRAEKIALKRFSTPQVANRRARRMAISAMKKRLLRGQNPQKVSIGQKERIERFIHQRRKIVDRLSTRMVSRVKQVEKARMSHKKFTKPNNGVTF